MASEIECQPSTLLKHAAMVTSVSNNSIHSASDSSSFIMHLIDPNSNCSSAQASPASTDEPTQSPHLISSTSSSSSASSTSSTMLTHPQHQDALSPLPSVSKKRRSVSFHKRASAKHSTPLHDRHKATAVVAQPESKQQLFVLNAFVNGFAQLKICADKIDYEYIVEIYWSSNTKTFIKRTYEDFVHFHRSLTAAFNISKAKVSLSSSLRSHLSRNDKNNNPLESNACLGEFIPELPTQKKPFWMSSLKLAESREIQLNGYVQRLLKLPVHVTQTRLFIEFFESKSCDPKPFVGDAKPRILMHHDLMGTSALGSESLSCSYTDEYDDDDEEFGDADIGENAEAPLSSHEVSLSGDDKRIRHEEDQSGLWWDEDSALNELTLCGGANSAVINFNDELNLEELIENYEMQLNIE